MDLRNDERPMRMGTGRENGGPGFHKLRAAGLTSSSCAGRPELSPEPSPAGALDERMQEPTVFGGSGLRVRQWDRPTKSNIHRALAAGLKRCCSSSSTSSGRLQSCPSEGYAPIVGPDRPRAETTEPPRTPDGRWRFGRVGRSIRDLVNQTSSDSSRFRVREGSTRMPGPIVVAKATFLRYRPLAAAGFARNTSSRAAA